MIREISKRQFDAYCYVRAPLLRYIAEEVAWFEAFNKKLMATVTRDAFMPCVKFDFMQDGSTKSSKVERLKFDFFTF